MKEERGVSMGERGEEDGRKAYEQKMAPSDSPKRRREGSGLLEGEEEVAEAERTTS